MPQSRRQVTPEPQIVSGKPEELATTTSSSVQASPTQPQSPSTTNSQETESIKEVTPSPEAREPTKASMTAQTDRLDLRKEPVATMIYKRQLSWAHKLGLILAKNRKPKSNYASTQLKKAAADPLVWGLRTLEHLQQITPENLISTEKPRKDDFVAALDSLDINDQWMLSGFVVSEDSDAEREDEGADEVHEDEGEADNVEEVAVEEVEVEQGEIEENETENAEAEDSAVSGSESVEIFSQKKPDSGDLAAIQASLDPKDASIRTMKAKDLSEKLKSCESKVTSSAVKGGALAIAIKVKATYKEDSEGRHTSGKTQSIKIVRKLPSRSKNKHGDPEPTTESEHEGSIEKTMKPVQDGGKENKSDGEADLEDDEEQDGAALRESSANIIRAKLSSKRS